MTLDAIIHLENIRHVSEGGGGYPYIWPVIVWFDSGGIFSHTPVINEKRLVLGSGLSVGESADIPPSLGPFRVRFEESTTRRSLVLVIGLWAAKESPDDAVRAGCSTFYRVLPERLLAHLGELINWGSLTVDQRGEIISISIESLYSFMDSLFLPK